MWLVLFLGLFFFLDLTGDDGRHCGCSFFSLLALVCVMTVLLKMWQASC